MQYSPEEYIRLDEAIEDDGGENIDALCTVRRYELSGHVGKRIGEDKAIFLPGCGNHSIYEIPYKALDGDTKPVKLCAICDMMGRFPRYADADAQGTEDDLPKIDK